MAQEKTEPATPKKQSEARNKGNVGKTTELAPAVMLLVAVWLLGSLAPGMAQRISTLTKKVFSNVANTSVTIPDFQMQAVAISLFLAQLVAPLVLAFVVVALLANVLQIGFLFTTKPLMPNLSKINPINGFKRLISPNAFVELFRTLMKVVIIGTVGGIVIFGKWETLASLADMPATAVAPLIMTLSLDVAWNIGWGLVLLAIFDLIYQRWRYQRSLRMSKEEVKDELKQVEGDPLVRSRIRQRQRAAARQRMMDEVPQATVVVTNPTHLAVALEYQPDYPAPKVVAKGQRLIADHIKKIARDNQIPLVENKPLAQTLFKTVDLGMFVPPDLYKAVAELLAIVFQLRPNQAPRAYQEAVGGAPPTVGDSSAQVVPMGSQPSLGDQSA